MTKTQKLQIERSEKRQRVNELLEIEPDQLTDEQRAEMKTLTKRLQEIEPELRAAIATDGTDETRATDTVDAETRERLELRGKASLCRYFEARMRGKLPDGAEAELQAAADAGDGIPLELWDVPNERRQQEDRATTPAPDTVGVNLDTIRPMVFANSIAPMLGIEMPRVASGTYATATIGTSATAAAKAKGAAIVATAGALTVQTTTPKRIAARLELAIEDIAAVGQSNFEAILRQNLSLALSDQLDNYAINGVRADNAAGDAAAQPKGIFAQLTDPTAPNSIANFDAFAAAHAGGVDGLWARSIMDVESSSARRRSSWPAGHSSRPRTTRANCRRPVTRKRTPADSRPTSGCQPRRRTSSPACCTARVAP